MIKYIKYIIAGFLIMSLTGMASSVTYCPSCGETINQNIELNCSLTCPGTGLKMGTDGITIDCKGHVINGSGAGYGVHLNGKKNTTVKNCNIHNFNIGIYIQGVPYGYSGSANDNKIFDNNITNNDMGIYIYSCCCGGSRANDNVMGNNNISGNSQYGVSISHCAYGNKIFNNIINDNGNGIKIEYSNNEIINSNIVCGNAIDFNILTSGNSGVNNTCNVTYNWNDDNATGCTYACPFCKDDDNDGYGVCPACNITNGCKYNGNDCNDTNESINPGAMEINNSADDNCNGVVDDILPEIKYLSLAGGHYLSHKPEFKQTFGNNSPGNLATLYARIEFNSCPNNADGKDNCTGVNVSVKAIIADENNNSIKTINLTYNSDSGRWSASFNVNEDCIDLPEGNYKLTWTVTESYGADKSYNNIMPFAVDKTPPDIYNVSVVNNNISINISDPSGIKSARLRYVADNETSANANIPVNGDIGVNAILSCPSIFNPSTINYYITATDNVGNTITVQLEGVGCVYATCDLNGDGIIIHDYNDLMYGYKCFLGIEKNCNEIKYQEWKNMKKEYECFTNSNSK